MTYKIQVQPDGDYVLTHNQVPMGIFKSKVLAEKGLEICVHPEIFYYDDEGIKLDAPPS